MNYEIYTFINVNDVVFLNNWYLIKKESFKMAKLMEKMTECNGNNLNEEYKEIVFK